MNKYKKKNNTLSIVIPVFNEEDNLNLLYKELKILFDKIKYNYNFEIIFVDDGSTDKSKEILQNFKNKDRQVFLIEFRKNFGQSAALDAGIKASKGEIIATLDADLQNDPQDIPILLQKLSEGFDVVVGWRKYRYDSLEKKLFSFLGNFLRRFLTGETIHDAGCTLRVYKRQVFQNMDLFGEMHRFIPSLLYMQGYKLGEVEVNHKKRLHGKSKYGFTRIFRGLVDLIFIVFLMRYSSRPIHVFGIIGLFTFFLGVLIGFYLTFIKLFYNLSIANRPLLILSVLLTLLGAQFFIFGILAEILIRIYYKVHKIKPYNIKSFA